MKPHRSFALVCLSSLVLSLTGCEEPIQSHPRGTHAATAHATSAAAPHASGSASAAAHGSASASTSAAVAPAPQPWATFATQYLDALFVAKPHLAMFMGDHRYDGRHADFAPEALAARRDALRAQRAALDALGRQGWSHDDLVDADIVGDAIDLELLYLDEIKDWEWDPRLHDSFPYYDPREIVAERLSMLVHGDFAPLATRLASLTGLLAGLPRLLTQFEAHQKRPARVYTEHAIDDNKGRMELVKGEVAEFIKGAATGGATPEAVAEAEKARGVALEALGKYQTFLVETLLPRSDGEWRLGAERYGKKFPLALQTKLTPDEVVPRARAAFDKARAELFALALELHKKLLPKEKRPEGDAVKTADAATQKGIIEAVRDVLAKDHPTAEDYVANEWRGLDSLRKLITEKDLLDLPPAATLLTIEMPAFKRGVIAAEYLAPGMLDRNAEWRGTYSVDPVDPRWPAEKAESYLRANNRYTTLLRAVHEAYPGHHVQTWYARQNLDPVRAVLWNAAMVEGWAVYGEDVMVFGAGLGGAENDHYKFFTLRGHMVVATNALLDIGLQTGKMSEAEAVRFMVEEGLQEKAMAEKKLVRAELDSTQLCQYFLGYDEILELERDFRAAVGEAKWKQRAFDEGMVTHGSVAVKHLRKYLLTLD
ncbi:MAG: DUF885 domain-containing protein [Polyangiaceae bacterium]|nr:DUF885 domain-containing protein [Polyangiaceae bacterium]